MRLGVNVDHVATVRQVRRGSLPDPVEAARACRRAGADSVVCHLREDRRHIQERDVERLRAQAGLPLNLEMSIAPEIVRAALRLRPHQVTLVPERRAELTTEGGLDIRRLHRRLLRVVGEFREAGIGVSLFVDPQPDQIVAAVQTGARIVELHTGGYANARAGRARAKELAALKRMAAQAHRLGLSVAAGHGLDYGNVGPIVAIGELVELNIGFAIVTRALFCGMEQALRQMKQLLCRR